jgi:hypothetical protein
MTSPFAAALKESTGAVRRTRGSRSSAGPAAVAGERNHVCKLVGPLSARSSFPRVKFCQEPARGLHVLKCKSPFVRVVAHAATISTRGRQSVVEE